MIKFFIPGGSDKGSLTATSLAVLTGLLFFFSCFTVPASGQDQVFTRQDTLRGSVGAGRSWWDLVYYWLDISVNPADSTISGRNTVTYRVLGAATVMQIDLQEPLKLTSAVQNGKALDFSREGSVWWITMKEPQVQGSLNTLVLSYSGRPKVSLRPPWSGGITWVRDSRGLPFVASSCQGDGASLWWPCKDHMYDEPDSMLISVRVPAHLTDVSNGRLRSVEEHGDGTKTFNWFVSSPINNYGVNINIGDYVHFSDTCKGEKGPLSCDYWVLRDNLDKAHSQFRQAPMMLAAFEHWFGPYPFYEDGYKLVEAPYLGMEHQSSVTYGNGFENGYRGTDLSGTGWGLKFDFIIIHESGHEWFANSITYEDIADMWVHESFTNYSESLYLEYYYGKEAGGEYVVGTRRNILNDKPIIGKYSVNNEGSHDMYYKGGNMLHTLRQVIGDDEKWRSLLRGLNTVFYHKVVKGWQIENYLSENTGMDLKPFFDQYLRDTRIPVLEYYIKGKTLFYRWADCVDGFAIPVRITIPGQTLLLHPSATFSSFKLPGGKVKVAVDPGWYIGLREIRSR